MNTLSVSERNGVFLPSQRWRRSLISLSLGLFVLVAVYWPTFMSMVDIWWRSETFAHGFLIIPISLFLVWRRRQVLTALEPGPDLRGLGSLALLGFGWLAAQVVDVQVIQQLCFVAMIVTLVWILLGWQVVKEIAFPLGFLFFAVPMGEFLIPPMMDFTANFTVKMIELTGIPVYREGTFFSIPSGDWSVVEGCSGLRYLIASITVGCLYAYLTYHSLWRRLGFIALSIGFPIVANGLRAYMIVMIAHFSDMKLALGVDHYIYGWVFFGLVMMLMFWIGSFWREDEVPETVKHETLLHPLSDPSSSRGSGREGNKSDPARLISTVIITVLILALWPLRASQIRGNDASRTAPVKLVLPQQAGAWQRIEGGLTRWEPRYLYPDAKANAVYSDGNHKVSMTVLYYRTQAQGRELVNSQNVLVRQKHPVWKMPWERPREIKISNEILRVREGILHSTEQQLLVWRWNWISGTFVINDHLAKLLEANDKLLGHPRDAAALVLATEFQVSPEEVRSTLRNFTAAMLPAIVKMLKTAEEPG